MTPLISNTNSAVRTQTFGEDSVLQEAKNIISLTNVETPLKGGLNTPLVSGEDRAGTPAATPNVVLKTPLRTPGGSAANQTPFHGTAATPMRQQSSDSDIIEQRRNLEVGLSMLPKPSNDYEIVLPDEEVEEPIQESSLAPDQADLDEQREIQKNRDKEAELKKRSQAVQRKLPLPLYGNLSLLKPQGKNDPQLTELQRAEELIKKEMMTMLHHDLLYVENDEERKKKSKNYEAQIYTYAKNHPMEDFDEESLKEAGKVLSAEMDIVKTGMRHGDITLDAFNQVWSECYSQLLYLPNHKRYTRASLASKKERIESLDKKLEKNRSIMTKEAKKAAKIEKKLKIILGGYQSRAASMTKQLAEAHELIEQLTIELETFKVLREHELKSMPSRVKILQEDVKDQMERESNLQDGYGSLLGKREDLMANK